MVLAKAEAFALAGAPVLLADLNEDALHAATCGLTTQDPAAPVARAVAELRRLGMAYNNAAILGPMANVTDYTGDAFDQVSAINLRGVWTCAA